MSASHLLPALATVPGCFAELWMSCQRAGLPLLMQTTTNMAEAWNRVFKEFVDRNLSNLSLPQCICKLQEQYADNAILRRSLREHGVHCQTGDFDVLCHVCIEAVLLAGGLTLRNGLRTE